MVLVVIIRNQILNNVVFKENKPFKNKSLNDWQEEEKFQHSFEEVIMDILHKDPARDLPKARIQTLVKSNLTRNFNLDTKNQFTKTTKPINFIRSTVVIRIIKLLNLSILLDLLLLSEFPKLSKAFQFWKISPNNYWKINIILPWANFLRSLRIRSNMLLPTCTWGKKNHYSRT
jgi:hypothetical protein